MYLKTQELGSEAEKSNLLDLMTSTALSDSEKVEKVKLLFNASGAASATQLAVKDYTKKAFGVLEKLNISNDKKQILQLFGEQLMNRRV